MEKFRQMVQKELHDIEKEGINIGNIDVASKLVDMLKDLAEIESEGGQEEMRQYRDYEGEYGSEYNYGRGGRGGYNDSGEDYGRRGISGGRGRYGHRGRFDDNLDRLEDCVEMYEYARGRYQAGGSEERMIDGLEKVMYAICMFVESAMNFAESPQEKEIIRKHVQKLQTM